MKGICVIVKRFELGPLDTNCYVVAPSKDSECVIIDPTFDSIPHITEALKDDKLHPIAAMMTHGHLDHTISVTPLCKNHNIPGWIHPSDREQLIWPERGFSPEMWELIKIPTPMIEPDEVKEFTDNQQIEIDGVRVTVRFAPGHTPGSVIFELERSNEATAVFTGDLIFKNGIGKTDMPGADKELLFNSIEKKFLTLDDSVEVFPGHGPTTWVGDERQHNPFLRNLQSLTQ